MSDDNYIKEDDIQEQILQAARQLLQIHGYQKVTMDDVAKAIGKGRSSLYYYYKNKEEIFEAVMDAEIRLMMTAMTRTANEASGAEEKIYAFCTTKLQILRTRSSLYNTMEAGMDAEQMSNYNKVKYAIHRQIMKQESALLNQILTYGIERGELRSMDQQQQDEVVFVLLCSLRGLKREMVIENDFSGIEQAVAALTRMAIYGLKK